MNKRVIEHIVDQTRPIFLLRHVKPLISGIRTRMFTYLRYPYNE